MRSRGWIAATVLAALAAQPAGAADADNPVDAPQIDPPRQDMQRVDPGPSDPVVRSPYIDQPGAPAAPRRGNIFGGPEEAVDNDGTGLQYRGDQTPTAELDDDAAQAEDNDAEALALPMDDGVARTDPDVLARELGGASNGARQSRAAEQSGIGSNGGIGGSIELLPNSGLFLILPQDKRRPPVVIQTPDR